MSKRSLTIAFVAALCGFLIAGLPLSLAVHPFASRSGIAFDSASGSIWKGTLHNVSVGGWRLGDLHLRLNPLYLALARAHVAFSFAGMDGEGSGIFESGIGSYLALKGATMRVAVEAVPDRLGLYGTISLEAVTLVLGGEGCASAQGSIATDVLAQNISALDWKGPLLDGAVECREGALYLPLAGARGDESVTIETLLFVDRRYETRAAVVTENPTLLRILPLLGFSNDAGVLALEQAGRWTEDQLKEPFTGG